MNTLRYLVLLPMIAIALAAPAHAEGKIGYVNLDRILRDAAPAQRAQKKLEAEFSKREQELAKTAESLKKMQDTLEKNAMTMSDSDRRNRERDFNEANRDFQRKQRETREDFNQRRNEELSGSPGASEPRRAADRGSRKVRSGLPGSGLRESPHRYHR